MSFISYAQNLEDVLLWRALKDVQSGFYIDVGAWDPRDDSVTLAFYERAWRGINVEPDPKMFTKLETQRPRDINLQVALGDKLDEKIFYAFDGKGWSTLSPAIARQHQEVGATFEQYRVHVMRLADICDLYAPADIHFLKIDVEGAELGVLQGADFTRHRPWIVIVEATQPNSPEENYQAWEGVLLDVRYKLAYFDGLNRYYVAEERVKALLPSFSKPPNVFDDYVSMPFLRKALAMREAGGTVPELDEEFEKIHEQEAAVRERELAALQEEFAKVHEQEAAVQERELAVLQERIKATELKAIGAEMRARLAEADARSPCEARLLSPSTSEPVTVVADNAGPVSQRQRVFYDVSLILRFGFRPPVGIVRVEQYVAELLARDSSIKLQFVTFDPEVCGYRQLRTEEKSLLDNILFNRYNSSKATPTMPEPSGTSDQERVATTRRQSFLRKIATSSRISAEVFNEILSEDLRSLLPIRPDHAPMQRAVTRVVRRSLAWGARTGHRTLVWSVARVGVSTRAVRFLVRPDPGLESGMSLRLAEPMTSSPSTPALNLSVLFKFERGDIVISMANTWDYMDYAYLTRIVRQDRVKLISVIYDVIAMEMPHTTPAAVHIYHRHWVELGHLATHLVAISKHSQDTYRRFIAEPNSLSPSMSYAYLPNFLYERREEIGETPVPEVSGRHFVIFCSTIETRKNHQLLLLLWDRLRQELDEDQLPMLVFVGTWGWGTETVRLLSERNWYLRNHLRILDKINDSQLIWLYRNASFTLFPALSEGFGLAAAESLSFGTPVIVSNCPALIEASEGLMPAYDPLDFFGWMGEVKRIITDDAYKAELRRKAALYRGGAYEDFGRTIRDAALGNIRTSDFVSTPVKTPSPLEAQSTAEEKTHA